MFVPFVLLFASTAEILYRRRDIIGQKIYNLFNKQGDFLLDFRSVFCYIVSRRTWRPASGPPAETTKETAMPIRLKEAIARSRPLLARDPQTIENRSQLLAPGDSALVKAIWVHNRPSWEVAALTGLAARALRRRLYRLVERMHSPEFLEAARAMPLLSAEQAAVARHHLLAGKSLLATSQATGLSYFRVRVLAGEARGIVEGFNRKLEAAGGSGMTK
jgi:hypothetical protein